MKYFFFSFNAQAKELSARFKDRPKPPMEEAVYWIEYVARHKGAPHLRSAAADLHWYQYLLLDVILFLVSIFAAILFVIRTLFRMVFKKSKPKQKTN